jgi:hypothetical protein
VGSPAVTFEGQPCSSLYADWVQGQVNQLTQRGQSEFFSVFRNKCLHGFATSGV